MSVCFSLTGMACRFPGSPNLAAFWQLLHAARCAVGPPPEGRWPQALLSEDLPLQAGYLEHPEYFDPAFFGLSQQEANSMDPQQRLLLELAWECLEDAGWAPESLRGRKVGVFIGISSADYAQAAMYGPEQVNMYTVTGLAASVCANRISYFFDFKGPSLVVDTACSASLVALHLARQSLERGESELALVGGANFLLAPLLQRAFQAATVLSPEGLCRPFDAQAQGIARGEGAGMVLLSPEASSKARQDRVYARLRGSAVTQDGLTQSLAAPSPAGQRETLRQACANAQIESWELDYLEAHGTGTPLGDPIEAKAIGDLLQARPAAESPCLIGSVKSNLGHLEAAAGMAGLIKTALSLYHRHLPASLHFQTPNPRIPFARHRLKVVQEGRPLPENFRFAGVSAFGFGGTNAHVVLEPAPSNPPAAKASGPYFLPLSAQRSQALQRQALALATWLEEHKDSTDMLARLESQWLWRRGQLPWRQAVWGQDQSELIQRLRTLPPPTAAVKTKPRLAFVFGGMGALRSLGQESASLTQALLAHPASRQALEACEACFSPLLKTSLLQTLQTGTEEDQALIQAAIFSLQWGLVARWQSLGIKPDAVLGSSMGELTAATVAGILSLEAAAKLLIQRIELLKTRIGTGSMAVVGRSEAELERELADLPLWVVTVNGPELCVVAGEDRALQSKLAEWQAAGLLVKAVPGATAPSHTPLIQVLEPQLRAAAQELEPQAGHLPFWSTVTGTQLKGEHLDADYWWQNVSSAVRLWPTVQTLCDQGKWMLVEISPQAVLASGLDQQGLPSGRTLSCLPTALRGRALNETLYASLARLYSLGRSPQSDAPPLLPPLDLPPYAWEEQVCWPPPPSQTATTPQLATGPQRPPQAAEPTPEMATKTILNRLRQSPECERQALLSRHLQRELAQSLNRDAEELDIAQPLRHLGIGSLMGMELYNRIRQDLGIKLPLSEVLKGPSLDQLSALILSDLTLEGEPADEPQGHIAAVTHPKILPLSPAQQRFWFFEQLYPGALAYHIPVLLQLEGPLDLDRLRSACAALVARHEILRTVYRQMETGVQQEVLPPDPEGQSLDWQVLPAQTETLEADLLNTARQPFALETHPPFRLRLFVLNATEPSRHPSRHFLLIDMHHLVADGYSFHLLYRDLRALYLQESALEAPVPFGEYVQGLAQKDLSPSRQWWLQALQDLPQRLELPGDFLRPAQVDFAGALYSFHVSTVELEPLEALARQEGITLYTLLMTAFELVLYRLSAQREFILGSPVLGRSELRWQEVVGPCLNLLPLPVRQEPTETVRAYLQRRQEEILAAFDHQEMPFEQLLEELHPERDPAWQALVQVVFALHAPVQTPDLGAVAVRSQPLDLGISRFDLALTLHPEAGGLSGNVEYRTTLYRSETVAAIVQLWKNVLRLWPQNLNTPLDQLQLSPWQAVLASPPLPNAAADLRARWQQRVQSAPNGLALQSPAGQWSAAALDQSAQDLAARLSPHLKAADHWVALCLPAGPGLVSAWLACWQAGAVPVPLDPAQPVARLRQLLQELNFAALLVPAAAAETWQRELKHSESDLPVLSPDLKAQTAPASLPKAPLAPLPPLAYAIFTSGSSGQPKAVAVDFAALRNLVDWHIGHYDLKPEDRCSQLASPSFDASVWELWPPLLSGASLHVPAPEVRLDPQALLSWLAEAAITQAFVPTPLMERLLQRWQTTPSQSELKLRHWLTGGARLHQAPPEGFPGQFWNHYGPTENTVVTTFCHIAPAASELPIGQPLPGVQLYLLDAAGQPLPPELPGELGITGLSLAQGYLPGGPETAQRPWSPFRQTPQGRLYRSGDRVRLQAGQIHFLGRVDRQIKHRGVRIEPGEIESLIQRYPGVQAVHLELRQGQLQAWLVADPPCELSVLRTWLAARLPAALVPDRLGLVPELPLTARGKVDAAALPTLTTLSEQNEQNKETQSFSSSPAGENSLEAQLGQLWAEVLNLKQVPGPEADFFWLGGHSLLAMELGHRIQTHFQVDFPLIQLFERPQLGAQARWLATQPASAFHWPELQPGPEAQLHEPFELTPVQQAYWIGRQGALELGAVSAHAYLELRLPRLEAPALEAAVQALIARHPMLRMQVDANGQQHILKQVPHWHLPLQDLRERPPNEVQIRLESLRQALEDEVRPADHWPLFALQLSRLPEGDLLHLSLDALMADATSMLILAQELGDYYQAALKSSDDSALQALKPPLQLSFKDWVHALQELRQSARYARDRAFWEQEAAQLPPAPQLPLRTSHLPPKPRYLRLEGRLEAPRWSQVKAQAQALGVSPTALLLSSFAHVLGRWQEGSALTLNLTTFQRPPLHPEMAQIVGDFTQLSLLPVSLQADFARQTQALQRKLLEVLDHSLFSGLELMRELRQHQAGESLNTSLNTSLMPVVFTSLLGQERFELPLQAELAYARTQTPQVWLDHQVAEIEGALLYFWDYPAGLFPTGLPEALFQAWQADLQTLANNRLPAPAPEEPQAPAPPSFDLAGTQGLLHTQAVQQAFKTPERLALLAPERQLSYADWLSEALVLAAQLRPLVQSPSSESPPRVALYLQSGWRQAVAVLAVLLAGGSYLPLHPDWPAERLQWLLDETQPCALVSERALTPRLESVSIPKLPQFNLEAPSTQPQTSLSPSQHSAAIRALEAVSPEAEVYLLFTSGSTGQPKGVRLAHSAVWNTVADLNQRLELGPEDRLLALSDLNFDLSVYDLFGPLSVGGALVYLSPEQRRDPQHWLQICQAQQVSVWNSVPALMQMLVTSLEGGAETIAAATLPDLRAVLLSGDWIPLALPHGIHQRLQPEAQLYSLGGATEAAIWSIVYPISDPDPDASSIPYGRALSGQAVYVLDSDLRPCPIWASGEIYIGGVGLALGYFKSPEQTAASFIQHPRTGQRLYRTGDYGRYRADGEIEFLGRRDQQVKIRGYRVELAEIEAQLLRQPGVSAAVVLAPGQREARYLAAWWTGSEADAQVLTQALQSQLPPYMLPVRWEHLESLPLNATGKVERQALLSRLEQSLTVQTDSASATPGLELWQERLRPILLESLDLPSLEPDQDLLALGMTSIEIVRLGNALQARFGLTPGMGELFQLRSLKRLAAFYAEQAETLEAAPSQSHALLLPGSSEMAAFKARHPALLPNPLLGAGRPLPHESDPEWDHALQTWRSQRQYGMAPLSLQALGQWLSPLQAKVWTEMAREHKYLYASAGGLYPVQVYLQLRPKRIQGLEAGCWYYHPLRHVLYTLPAASPSEQAEAQFVNGHFPPNRPLAEQAALAVYLVVDLRAIEPVYGPDSRDYALLEAGSMAQLLRQEAARAGLGHCLVGQVDRQSVSNTLALAPEQELLLTLLAGPLQTAAPAEPQAKSDEEWEEWII